MDWCELCDGIWLDAGELTRLTHTATEIPAMPPEPARKPAPHPVESKTCPRCSLPLEEASYDTPAPVRLDRCPACHGLWLDRGELQTIYGQVGERLAKNASVPADNTPDSLATTVLIVMVIILLGLIAALAAWYLAR